MSTGRVGRRRWWLTRVVAPAIVVVLILAVVWQVNGALARSDVRVYPVAMLCGGERQGLELPRVSDVLAGTPVGPTLRARLVDTRPCQVYVEIANEGSRPVTVRSADLPALAASTGSGGYWQSTRDVAGRRPATVGGHDARFRLSETIEPGEAWTWSFYVQHRPGTTFCDDLVITQRLPVLDVSVYGARGSVQPGVWIRTSAEESIGPRPESC